jgi:hypothetical protein
METGLGRIPHFDERSREYPVRALFLAPPSPPRKRIWTPRSEPLDQGREGACVGFSWSAELAANPWKHPVDDASAFALYQAAREQDRAVGNNFSEGASILAGAKACHKAGKITAYRWAFGIDDVCETLMRRGPVVLGIAWYESMYETLEGGLVTIGGACVGGHAILAHGIWPAHPLHGDVIVWTNSWGSAYGENGRGYIRVADLDRLLKEDGEACIPVDAKI